MGIPTPVPSDMQAQPNLRSLGRHIGARGSWADPLDTGRLEGHNTSSRSPHCPPSQTLGPAPTLTSTGSCPHLTGLGSIRGSWPGFDFLGLEGPPGLEKGFGDLVVGDVRDLPGPWGCPSCWPPPEKGTKSGSAGSGWVCSLGGSMGWGSAASSRLPSPWLSPSGLGTQGAAGAGASQDFMANLSETVAETRP